MRSDPLRSEFRREVDRDVSIEPSETLFSTETSSAHLAASGWLKVFWPSVSDPEDATTWERENTPQVGTESCPEEPAVCSWSAIAVEFAMPVVLVGDVKVCAYRNGFGVVVRHVCPSSRHTWLGPWDEAAAQSLAAALRSRLALPRGLGPLVRPSEAALLEDPRRYHGARIAVEGRWHRAHEAPDFIAESRLVFPPGFRVPDRPRQLRVEGVWVLTRRPGIGVLGPDRELHAGTVEEVSWAAGLPVGHPRVHGLPLPERLVEWLEQGRWALGIVRASVLLSATGWARQLETFFGADEIEAEMLRLRAMDDEEKLRLGFANDVPRCLDETKALILAKNPDGRMIALDYREDPPLVMLSEEARGALRWRRLDGDFDAFASNFCDARGC